jgi:7,8-dihydropterin-6-yl-methyl-4-(beta-D-ribofuranosyl)aminobenzene 5'-phosphate synthase
MNQESVMQTTPLSALKTAVVSIWLLASWTATQAAAPTTAASLARITVLYDAFGKDATLSKDWGYAALVEVNGKRILFDTGDDAAVLAKNVKAKGIDLRKLDFVVLSHRHSDHVSGLSYVLSKNPQVKIYAPKEAFGIFGSDLPSTFYRKDDSLPAEMRYYDGAPPETMKFGTLFPGAKIQLIDKTTQVMPGITLIALVSDSPGTKELKELSLAIDTPEGVVLMVGCSHPGIEAIVAEAARIDSRIHFLAGGLHLVAAQDPLIEKVVNALHDTYKVDFIAPGHCTGEPTFAALQKAFGERYLYAGLGVTLSIGARPRAASNRSGAAALEDADSRSYRALLARSDDLHESGVQLAQLARVP